ncbi:unnamed protein product, partial [Mesorhabditis belari]|uniref:Histone deacetylase domain-containing protein n=1 Tax=Mesorhabditis belari TaxID=2138241 RepID=A0AAF3ENA4_9BILA
MDGHFCPWNTTHIEVPQRLQVIREAFEKSGVLNDGVDFLEPRMATKDEILSVHTEEYYTTIEKTKGLGVEDAETESGKFEDIFLNGSTFDLSLLSAGCAIDLTRKVVETGKSGFAAIRPPGHHAFKDAACGFCVFNNVVICAKQAQKAGAKKVFILDWDVHAGQGTQECIEEDENIRLLSSHRFENGTFWPNLEQSAVEQKFKHTVNVPLNAVGLGDSEFLAIMYTLVLPILQDFRPDLIIVSCGFDAAFGDPEGLMRISPKGYGCLTRLILSTGIPCALILEGGYFLDSIAADSVEVMRSLKGHQPYLPIEKIHPEFLKTLLRVLRVNSSLYPSFLQQYELIEKLRAKNGLKMPEEDPEFRGERILTYPFPTRNIYKERSEEILKELREALNELTKEREQYKQPEKKLTIVRSDDFDVEIEENEIKISTPIEYHNFFHNTLFSPLCGHAESKESFKDLKNAKTPTRISEILDFLGKLLKFDFLKDFPFVQLCERDI